MDGHVDWAHMLLGPHLVPLEMETRKPILSEPGSILVDGFDTRLIPRSFSCGLGTYLVPLEMETLVKCCMN